jgi:hypothetical protein
VDVHKPKPSGWRGALCAALPVALAVALLVGGSAAHAVEQHGVRFADSYHAGGTRLNFFSAAKLQYKILFTGFVVALYLQSPRDAADILADVPKRLEFEYFWSIPATAFVESADKLLARNTDAATLQRLRGQIGALNALYQDVKPHDRYALTYTPGHGTELSLNGRPLGVVPGSEFAAVYFSIWFGSEPLKVSLKQALLNPAAD